MDAIEKEEQIDFDPMASQTVADVGQQEDQLARVLGLVQRFHQHWMDCQKIIIH